MSWTFDGVVEFACLGKEFFYRAMFCLLAALISIDQAKGGLISDLISERFAKSVHSPSP